MEWFIKIHRKIVQWEWYDDVNTKVLFLHLLLTVNYKQGKWRWYVIEPWSIITSLPKLAKQCRLTMQKLRTSLKKLESTWEITCKSTSTFTCIILNNWATYNILDNRQITDEQHADNMRVTSIEEYKNNKKERILDNRENEKIDFTVNKKIEWEVNKNMNWEVNKKIEWKNMSWEVNRKKEIKKEKAPNAPIDIESDAFKLFTFWNNQKQSDAHWKWVRVLTNDIKKLIDWVIKEYGKDNVEVWLLNYKKEIKTRDQSNWTYWRHRFTLQEFLKQGNGLTKYFNIL